MPHSKVAKFLEIIISKNLWGKRIDSFDFAADSSFLCMYVWEVSQVKPVLVNNGK